jgi:hypothetical protein
MLIQEQTIPEITTEKRRRYAQQLMRNIKRWDDWEEEHIREMLNIIERAQNDLLARWVQARLRGEPSEFELFRFRHMSQNFAVLYNRLEVELRALMNKGINTAFRLGSGDVVDSLKELGIGVRFFQPSLAQANALAGFTAALITEIINDIRKAIDFEIRNVALGIIRPIEGMVNVTKKLGLPPKPGDPTDGVAFRAERIVRTETNRVFNMATYSQQLALQRDFPGLQKSWLATSDTRTRDGHLFAHRQTVAVDEPFKIPERSGKIEKLQYPTDPIGSPNNVIQCRCRSITVMPGMEIPRGPLDRAIEKEQLKRSKQT